MLNYCEPNKCVVSHRGRERQTYFAFVLCFVFGGPWRVTIAGKHSELCGQEQRGILLLAFGSQGRDCRRRLGFAPLGGGGGGARLGEGLASTPEPRRRLSGSSTPREASISRNPIGKRFVPC